MDTKMLEVVFNSGFKNDKNKKIKASNVISVEKVCAYREFMVYIANVRDGIPQFRPCCGCSSDDSVLGMLILWSREV